jgi:GH24 family phage-related lysozyme (muramidase)
MWPSVLQSFRTTLVSEGYARHMYLDTRGLVTTGQGDLIDPVEEAQKLPWLDEGLLASTEAVTAAWNLVKSHQEMKAEGGMAFAKLTTLRLTDGAVSLLVTKTCTWMISTLEERYPWLIQARADAQLAVLRWAWANGPNAEYPKMFAALERGDYAAANAESVWTNETEETRAILEALFSFAAEAEAHALDPSVLLYPTGYFPSN